MISCSVCLISYYKNNTHTTDCQEVILHFFEISLKSSLGSHFECSMRLHDQMDNPEQGTLMNSPQMESMSGRAM